MTTNRPRRNPLAFIRHFPTEPQVVLMVVASSMFAALAVMNFIRMLDYPDLDWSDVPVGGYEVQQETAAGPYVIHRDRRGMESIEDSTDSEEALTLHAYGHPVEYRDTLTAWTLAHGGAIRVSDEWSYRTNLRIALPQPALERLEALVDDDTALMQWIEDARIDGSQTDDASTKERAGAPLLPRDVSITHGSNKTDMRDKALLYGALSIFMFVTMAFLFRHERRNYRAGNAVREGRIWA